MEEEGGKKHKKADPVMVCLARPKRNEGFAIAKHFSPFFLVLCFYFADEIACKTPK